MAISNPPVDTLALLVHHLLDPEGSAAKLKERSAELVARLADVETAKAEAATLVKRADEVRQREVAAQELDVECAQREAAHRDASTALFLALHQAIGDKAAQLDAKEAELATREASMIAAEARLAALRELAKKLA